MEEFEDLLYSPLKPEQVCAEISKRIEEMQKLYSEIIRLASTHDQKVWYTLRFPDNLPLGHNSSMVADIHWNPSSQYCGNGEPTYFG